jgi:DNA-directed RNA polymerase specialized sigma24 family protein
MVQTDTWVQVVATRPQATTGAGRVSGSIASVDDASVTQQDNHPPVGGPDRSAIAALVQAAGSGDQQAWNGLVDKFASTVWAIARGYRLNAADAADVSKTTWLRLEALRVLRMAGRQIPNGDDFEVLPDITASVSPDRGLLAAERDRLVAELIEQLPERSQILLRLLSADSPLSYRDISEALSMPIGSIGPTRARALEQLRRLALRAGFQLEDGFV